MSKDKLTDYDATASNNTDIGGISIAEGMLPSAVNNSLREQMSHLKEALGSGTPLYVDQTNNLVGVGTTSIPTGKLAIEGGIYLSGSSNFLRFGQDSSTLTGIGIHRPSNTSMAFVTSGNERARVTDNGLTFNGDTAAANALDDYEEGFYTPTDVSGQGLTITNSGASYVKIGKLVHVSLYITFPVTSNTAQAKISLPYGAASTSYGYSYLNGRLQNGSGQAFESAFTCQVNAGSNNFYVGYYNTTNSQVFTYNNLTGNYLLVSGTYVSDT